MVDIKGNEIKLGWMKAGIFPAFPFWYNFLFFCLIQGLI